jgi:uncharacterized tellurite resistance protein B-like protein
VNGVARTRKETQLLGELQADPSVRRAVERVNELTSGYGYITRRRLLTSGVRLTPRMHPPLAEAVEDCRSALGLERRVDTYVVPDSMMSASCSVSPDGGVSIALSSRLLETFSAAELRFVVGHELGHVCFDHLSIPMPLTATVEDYAGKLVSKPLALRLYVWTRAAEVSADRAGLLCCGDVDAAAIAFFKLASGLGSLPINPDLDAFSAQLDALAATPEARTVEREDDDTLACFRTHPYSALRLRALLAFSRSEAFRRAMGMEPAAESLSDDQLEQIVERDLELMEPSYLEETTAVSTELRELLFYGGLVVAAANGEVAASERSALRALLGADVVDRTEVAIDAAPRELDTRLTGIEERIPLRHRAQLVQHLAVIAAADGEVCDAEWSAMRNIATRLSVDPAVINHTLDAAASPID